MYFKVNLRLNLGTIVCFIEAKNERALKKLIKDVHGRDPGNNGLDFVVISKEMFESCVAAKA